MRRHVVDRIKAEPARILQRTVPREETLGKIYAKQKIPSPEYRIFSTLEIRVPLARALFFIRNTAPSPITWSLCLKSR